MIRRGGAYIFVGFLFVILVLIQVIVIFVILVLKVGFIEIITEGLESQSLSSEPVNGTGYQLLLDVLTESVVELEALLDILRGIVILVSRRLGR